MKKTVCLILIFLIATSLVACSSKHQDGREASYDMLSFVAPAASPFDRKWYSFVDVTDGYNPTQYLIPAEDELGRNAQGIDDLNLKESKEAVDCLITNTKEGIKYTIEGSDYFPVTSVYPKNDVSLAGYEWHIDRSFFYKYADTKQGAQLYRSLNCNTDEVVIFVDGTQSANAEDVILAKADSALLDSSKYSIADFGIAVINAHSFVNAAFFEKLFAAHARGTDAKMVEEDDWMEKTDRFAKLVFEYVRIPGLRYTLWMSESEQAPAVYVYSRAAQSVVCIESKSGIPYEKVE